MNDETPSQVLGSLPRTRPHRRSQRRAARPGPGVAPAENAVAPGTAATKGAAVESAPARTAAKPKPAPQAKRAPAKQAPAKQAPAARMRQPAQPAGTPSKPKPRGTEKPKPTARRKPSRPATTTGTEILGTAVQAAAELTEIGLSVSARALRRAVSRLPRP